MSSLRAVITWLMPMLLAALVATCPQTELQTELWVSSPHVIIFPHINNKTLLISNNESVWIVACFCLSVCPFVWAFFVHPCVLVLCEKSGTCARAWSGNSIWLAGHSYSFWHLSIFSFVKVSSWWIKIEREGLEWIDLSECKSYRLLQSQPLIRS